MTETSRSAVVRSSIYGELARGFAYPGAELLDDIEAGDFGFDLIDLVTDVHPDLFASLTSVRMDLETRPADLVTLEGDYLATFETGPRKPPLSLYEGSYVTDRPRAELLLEIDAFYRHFGLVPGEAPRDFVDTLTAELEFLQFLVAKEAQAIEQALDADPYRRAQHDFLDRHLVPFLTAMDEASEDCTAPFYRGLVRCTHRFVAAEAAAVTRRLAASAA
ncbi:molecular chaperone TorD family protein [Rhodoplanes azumiensis]|uniref:Molecular chaperone TorD family protein n=1 Tax=Rhodoplanes azumiensis TaxID=1897628 RepID=A0ABW5ATA7_9BRAD